MALPISFMAASSATMIDWPSAEVPTPWLGTVNMWMSLLVIPTSLGACWAIHPAVRPSLTVRYGEICLTTSLSFTGLVSVPALTSSLMSPSRYARWLRTRW